MRYLSIFAILAVAIIIPLAIVSASSAPPDAYYILGSDVPGQFWPDNTGIDPAPFSAGGTNTHASWAALSMGFTNTVHITSVCWDNLTHDGDYFRGAGLFVNDEQMNPSARREQGSASGFTANGRVCVTNTNTETVYSQYWSVLTQGTAQWGRFAETTIEYTVYDPATPTPTATVMSTPFVSVVNGPCVTPTSAVSATAQATPTPYGTARPTATRNPSMSPTPTVTATATTTGTTSTAWQQIEWRSEAGFDGSLQPWTAGLSYSCPTCDPQYVPKATGWLTGTVGQDGLPGVAQVGGWGLEYDEIIVGDAFKNVPLNASDHNEALDFDAPGSIILALPTDISRPINIQGVARVLNAPATGMHVYISVWYLDPGSTSEIMTDTVDIWVSKPDYSQEISYVWGEFGIRLTPDHSVAGYKAGTAQALLITWYVKSDQLEDLEAVQNAILVDDIQVTLGDGADAILPICNSTGGVTRTGKPEIPTRVCVVNFVEQNMFARCVAPTGLDLGAWLSYLWCNIVRFFGFYSENTDQVNLIVERQSVVEPFGSIAESGDIYDDLDSQVDTLRSASQTRNQIPIDWAAMFLDGSALNWARLAQFAVPDVSGAAEYMSGCSQEVIDVNTSIANGACMAIYLMNRTIIVTFLQWGLNALFVVGILMMVRGDLEKLAS